MYLTYFSLEIVCCSKFLDSRNQAVYKLSLFSLIFSKVVIDFTYADFIKWYVKHKVRF